MSLDCLTCGGILVRNRRYSTVDYYRCADCGRVETAPKGYYAGIDPDYERPEVLCACGCEQAVPQPQKSGRPARWVSDAHRKRAERRAAK